MGKPMLVLGIDPGTAITGYGFVRYRDGAAEPVAYGAIITGAGLSLPSRLQSIYQQLSTLIEAHRPTQAAVEQLFFARNARTALTVGHARGVILLALQDAGIPVHEYTPLEVKMAITGYGRADKEQMQQMVRLLLNLESIPQPDDVADALAVAVCHAHSHSTTARLAEQRAESGRER
jgi:crossover junction endodeoxyribonuclease RuvC